MERRAHSTSMKRSGYAPRKSASARSSYPTSISARGIAGPGELLEFLESIEVDYLFLVGDIVDFWSLRRSFYWPEAHNEVLRAILAMAKQGTRVIYVPGNHDENIREFCGSLFGNVSIRRRYVHSTADGRRIPGHARG